MKVLYTINRAPLKGLCMLGMFLCVSLAVKAQQGLTAEEAEKANNPLASTKSFNLQNYYVPAIYEDSRLRANSMLMRYVIPLAEGKVLMRATLPLSTSPAGYDGNGTPQYGSGLGDLNFFATYTFSKPSSKTLLGIGPQVVIPTATSHYTGAGKWQLGGAFIMFNTASPAFQYGLLVTYQASIAGDGDRSNTSSLVVQPIGLFQLGKGLYLRSTAVWNFNLQANAYNVPIGIGIGHLAKAGKIVFNIFMEPQFTVLHQGTGQPAYQVFAGINAQF